MTTFYEIRNRAGTLVAIHKRTDGADGKSMSWLGPDGTSGLNGTPTSALPLYGAHLLDSWPASETIIFAEGEKSAQALIDAGFAAVASVTGASATPDDDVLADLEGRVVALWPDADTTGREHMTRVGDSLAPRAAVAWLEPPADAPKGWDAADAVAAGMEIRELLRNATAYVSEADAYRTLADVSDEPPGPLLLGMLEPAGPNLLYAAPGVGKGTTGAWLCRETQALGMRPVVYDAEQREREWARRVSGMGGDRANVVYITPAELGPKYAGLPLWESIERLARKVQAAGGDVLLVDSILPATRLAEERLRSDAAAPWLYVDALESLGIPTVSFGHPPKGQPEGDPFGSFAWVAAPRLTWLGTKAEGEGHRIRWRPRKRNERGHIPGVLLSVEYGEDGRPCGVVRDDDEESTREWLLLALKDGARSMTDLADELLDDAEDHVTPDQLERTKQRLRQALNRMKRDGLVTREGGRGGPKVRWALRWES